jgi:4'-phosphopantetheinyl transferase EntD
MFELPSADLFARLLGVPFALATARTPCALLDLSAGERAQLRGLCGEQRRTDWLCGRAALKELLVRAGEDPETSRLNFPNSRFSLTHSQGVSVAVGVSRDSALGVGIDLERGRAPSVKAARFFLTEEEQCALECIDELEHHAQLLRLWTVKEAVFKADPANTGRVLLDYATANPLEFEGRALPTDGLRTIHYASVQVPAGFLSVATIPIQGLAHAAPAPRERTLVAQFL